LSKKEQALREAERAKAAERMTVLKVGQKLYAKMNQNYCYLTLFSAQLRIQARQKTIDDYKLRKLRLFEENVQLRREIEGMEVESHAHVKKLLRKYEQYRVRCVLRVLGVSP
jgi:hypothetical protein